MTRQSTFDMYQILLKNLSNPHGLYHELPDLPVKFWQLIVYPVNGLSQSNKVHGSLQYVFLLKPVQ